MSQSNTMSAFAQTICNQKYSHNKHDGTKETWPEIAHRVSKNVLKVINAPKSLVDEMTQLITDLKFIPGGRYLYASGRPLHQTQNCLLLRAVDSREGWADLMQKITMALMTGAGIGVDYSDIRAEGKIIRKTGGFATGPIALMQMVNEAGRGIMQGGARRSAIWAGLKWSHPDIQKFIVLKNWIPEVRALKEKDFNFPAPMDGTNVSVQLDDEFFKAYHNDKHKLHAHAHSVYWSTVRQMLKTGEPGFSIDLGAEKNETLRNAPICANTQVLTSEGYLPVSSLLGRSTSVWTGLQWSPCVEFKRTKQNAPVVKVTMTGGREICCDLEHPFLVEKYTGAGERRKMTDLVRVPASSLVEGDILHVSLPASKRTSILNKRAYTLGYIYGDGSFTHAGGAELTFCTPESKACSKIVEDHELLSSINPCDGRGYTRAHFSVDNYWEGRSKHIFPLEMFSAHSDVAAGFLAGLFDADGNWEPTQRRLRLSSKHEGFLRDVSRLLEQHGILSGVSKSGISTYGQEQTYQLVVMSEYNRAFARFVPTIRLKPEIEDYTAYRQSMIKVRSVEPDGFEDVYCVDVQLPEHSFQAEGVIISNCTEVTSEDDSDICNLGSINLAQITSLEEMERVTELGTMFLLAGTMYSDVPYARVDTVRTKNRRLGLGLMGIHEWLLLNGLQYAPSTTLAQYLDIYATSTEIAARYADEWEISKPVKTRAIAPTGTIGIIAGTSTGAEPLFCVAYKRRYLKGSTWNYQYVIDPTAKRLIENGVNADTIEDAYSLAEDGGERRVNFQAWLQKYVDHSISSTINLPAWGSELNNDSRVQDFGKMLIKYLPQLRGITVYPDGARNGQPLTPVKYSTAIKHIGEIFIEAADICSISGVGTCGS